MTRTLAIVAVIVSGAALALSVHTATSAKHHAKEALREREQVAVDRLKPKVLRILEDFDADIPQTTRDAKTLDDLLMPLFKTIESVSK